MTKVSVVENIVDRFSFAKGDYAGAESQLLKFAENYVQLSRSEAETVRCRYDSKMRLGWFRIAASLFEKLFADASHEQQQNLLKIFFALYSFENLGFGYDALMNVIKVSDQIKESDQDVIALWADYKTLTSNILAVDNLENKVF